MRHPDVALGQLHPLCLWLNPGFVWRAFRARATTQCESVVVGPIIEGFEYLGLRRSWQRPSIRRAALQGLHGPVPSGEPKVMQSLELL